MDERVSSRPDAATSLGVGLLAFFGLLLISYLLGVTKLLVAAYCGAPPPTDYLDVEAIIAFSNCQSTVEHRYFAALGGGSGIAFALMASVWARREAKQSAKMERELDEEIAQIRAEIAARDARPPG
ncbi:MAG TPA: hypothetical protein PKY87_03030 [Terricaulis sp.]|nr:hypothetical protein [Terricaulis sp.]